MITKILQHIAATGGLVRNKWAWAITAGIIIGLYVLVTV